MHANFVTTTRCDCRLYFYKAVAVTTTAKAIKRPLSGGKGHTQLSGSCVCITSARVNITKLLGGRIARLPTESTEYFNKSAVYKSAVNKSAVYKSAVSLALPLNAGGEKIFSNPENLPQLNIKMTTLAPMGVSA